MGTEGSLEGVTFLTGLYYELNSIPPNSQVEALTPGGSQGDCIWSEGLERGDEVKNKTMGSAPNAS